MDDSMAKQLLPGAQVKITQQIAARDRTWTATHEGTVVEYQQRPTGSWFAHAKDDHLWLDRLLIKKADGELLTFNMDNYTHVQVIALPPVAAAGQL